MIQAIDRRVERTEEGYILASMIVTLTFIMLIGVFVTQLIIANILTASREVYRVNAQLAADAGADAAIIELNNDEDWEDFGSEVTFLTTSSFRSAYYAEVIDDSEELGRVVEVVGRTYELGETSPIVERKYEIELRGLQSISGDFAIISGVGGLILENSSKIVDGDVYVNGSIDLSNTAQIGTTSNTVNVKAAHYNCPLGGGVTFPDLCTSGEPITVNNSAKIYGEVCANNQTTGTGMLNPGLLSLGDPGCEPNGGSGGGPPPPGEQECQYSFTGSGVDIIWNSDNSNTESLRKNGSWLTTYNDGTESHTDASGTSSDTYSIRFFPPSSSGYNEVACTDTTGSSGGGGLGEQECEYSFAGGSTTINWSGVNSNQESVRKNGSFLILYNDGTESHVDSPSIATDTYSIRFFPPGLGTYVEVACTDVTGSGSGGGLGGLASLPLPDHDRDSQKANVTTTSSSSYYTNCNSNSATRIWPAGLKIEGDVSIRKKCKIFLQGDVWITGSLEMANSAEIIVDNSITLGAPNTVDPNLPTIMVDDADGVRLLNKSKVRANASDVGAQLITYWSDSTCSPDCATLSGQDLHDSQGVTTIYLEQSSDAPGSILYARWSQVDLNNGGDIGALAGQTIRLRNSSSVTFGTSVTSGGGPTPIIWLVEHYRRVF